MPVRRSNGNIPAGGSVVLQGLPGRKSFWFQNQSAAGNMMSVAFASGFTVKALQYTVVQRAISSGADVEGLQGAITISGTAGDAYDVEETYS